MTPIMGDPINLTRLGELGRKGVLALLSDSTNAERPGLSTSERHVGATFDELFRKYTDKRIIVATFASNVHRVQQVIDSAVRVGRKVAVSGRSMVNVLTVARQLGYMHIPDGTLVELDEINKYPHDRMVIITTAVRASPCPLSTAWPIPTIKRSRSARATQSLFRQAPFRAMKRRFHAS